MMRFFPALAAGVWFLASSVSAQTYDCHFPKQGTNSFVRNQIVVKLDPGTGQVTVFDSLINQQVGGPIAAQVKRNDDNRLTLRWQLKNVKTKLGSGPFFNYSLSYFKTKDKATANVNAPGIYIPGFLGKPPEYYSANGTCAQR